MNDTNEEMIVNKIVPIETIFEVAEYFEDVKDQFARLDDIDTQKNKDLKYSEQTYEYKGANSPVQYTIDYKDGRKLTQSNYNWFKSNFNNPKIIKAVYISFITSYSSKMEGQVEYKQLSIHISMFEKSIYLSCRGNNNDERSSKMYYDLTNIISNNEERYNNTVKHRKVRIQSFCLSVGIVLSYLIYIAILMSKSEILLKNIELLGNKKILIIEQWVASATLGNLIGLPYMKSLYNTIIPRAKYSHYSKLDKKSVYTDDIEEYISQDEVQIGIFTDNGKKRMKIEKIYKVTKRIVLVQLLISIILFLIIK